MAASFSRVIRTANPTELICSSSSRGTVVKSLVIRNSLPESVFLKLVVSKDGEGFITLDNQKMRIAANAVVRVEMYIHMNRVGTFCGSGGQQISGYVIPAHGSLTDFQVQRWLHEKNEAKRQLAFRLNIRFSSGFSARDTIIDLPGLALLVGLDDFGTSTAHPIDEDCLTARNCDSIADYLAEVKRRKVGCGPSLSRKAKKLQKEANWGLYEMANSVAETVKTWCETKPTARNSEKNSRKKSCWKSDKSNQKSEKSSKKSSKNCQADLRQNKKTRRSLEISYVNHEMNATPCGGN